MFWGTQAPIRLTFLFALTGYSYAFRPASALATKGQKAGLLNNSVVFTWGFLELATWFWVSRSAVASWDCGFEEIG